MPDDYTPHLPLSPASLHILLALAGEDRHGYGIMQDVVRQSEGRYKLGPGTLYDNLQKLTEQGLIETVSASRGANQDSRRKYYRLTRFGRGVLEADVARLERVLREARAHSLAPKPGRAT